jgi:hypothetical protein
MIMGNTCARMTYDAAAMVQAEIRARMAKDGIITEKLDNAVQE